MLNNLKNSFFIIFGFGLSCLSAEPESPLCQKDQVVIRHFGTEDKVCSADEELDFKPWYHRHEYYDTHEEKEHADPTGKLQDDTAWPGEREEYSDYLLRDLNDK